MKIALQTLVKKAETWLGILVNEVIACNTNLENTTHETPKNNPNPNEQSSIISRDQLQEFIKTIMQGIK